MTNVWTKLKVTFESCVDLDVAEIHECVSQVYDLGYTGLYLCDDYTYVLMQTSHKKIQMSPNKVNNICCRFGDIAAVDKFSDLQGTCIEEIGVFRKRGRKSPSVGNGAAASNGATTNNSTTNNIDNSTTTNNITNNNDNSVTHNTIHLHVHAFGQEDVSGITLAAFKELVGDKEEILDMMKRTVPDMCEVITKREWEKVKHRLYVQHCRASIPRRMAEALADDSDSAVDLGEGGIYIPKTIGVRGEVATHEKVENDGGYAEDLRKMVEEFTLLEEEARYRSIITPGALAELMYEDPHNCNIMVTTKDGYMKYYDGEKWQKVRVDNMDMVIKNWEKKFTEAVEMLKQKEGEAMTESFQGQLCQQIISNFDQLLVIESKFLKRFLVQRKRDALLALDKVNARFKDVQKVTGKKVKRGSASETDANKQKYLKEATWAKLMEM
eukprot:g16361.t1